MSGTVRTVRIVLIYAAATLWVAGITAATLWTAGIATDTTPRLLSVVLTAAATCTVSAVACWLHSARQDQDKDMLIRVLTDQVTSANRHAGSALARTTRPLRRAL